jgi:hypothetical protein
MKPSTTRTIAAAIILGAWAPAVLAQEPSPVPPGRARSPNASARDAGPGGASNDSNGAPDAGVVPRINQEAQQKGNELNEQIVGPATQQQNERSAENPANASKRREQEDKAEARKAANEIGRTTTTAANVVGQEVADVTASTDRPGRYDPFAIEYDPLGLIVGGRVSFNLEWAPITHHVFQLSPHFVHTSADVAVSPSETESQAFTGFGGELGYRYYTGHRGMNGVFVGPSLIAGAYNAGLPSGNQPFTDIGIAADVGIQEIFFNHLVVGGGVGIEYLSVSHDFHDLPTGPATIASSGVKPRFLLEAGYGF